MSNEISFHFNGEKFTGTAGQSVAAALIATGQRELRKTRFGEEPRSIFCGIGICFDCVVTINGVANQRACLIEISSDMKVESSL
jgi:aerobic-type carbon monoxide dehydrogenase small subunit (CoxS/CutS family)